jgi:ferredoxin
MKIVVNWKQCEGNGACAVEAPDVFDLDDDDNLIVLEENPPEERRRQVEAAARACPKRALAIEA